MSKKSNAPIFSQQLGAIRAAVWESSDEDGRVYHNVSITRSYRERNSDEWKETSSFNGLTDLALVREAARLAANWIEARERELEAND